MLSSSLSSNSNISKMCRSRSSAIKDFLEGSKDFQNINENH